MPYPRFPRVPARALLLGALLLALALTGSTLPVTAQEGPAPAVFGDPPIAALITISEPDEAGLVTIEGDWGAVFPGAVVAIRNMYTGETVYPRAELTGAFVAQIHGTPNTPYWISPSIRIETFERYVPEALPGGPGTILYGGLPARNAALPPAPSPAPSGELPETPVVLDGDAAEWPALASPEQIGVSEGGDGLVYAFANQDSLYLAVAPASPEAPLPTGYQALELGFRVDGRRYLVQIDPQQRGGGRLYGATVGGGLEDFGPLAGLSIQGEGPEGALELRFPRTAFTGWPAPVALEIVRFARNTYCLVLGDDFWAANLFLPVTERDEIDSVAGLPFTMPVGSTAFTLGGPVGGGTGTWTATGRINQMAFAPGDTLLLEMQVTMQAPEMPGDGPGLHLGATLRLEPVAVDGAQTVADRLTGNGWSGQLTASALPVENVSGGVTLGSATAQRLAVVDGTLTFRLQWRLRVDERLPDGLYTPTLSGFATVPGLYGRWHEPGILGGVDSGSASGIQQTRLPLVLQIGQQAAENRLVWALFADHPAGSGARGLLPEEDAGRVALNTHTALPGGVYVLPATRSDSGEPIPYPLEPYLPAMLSNSYYDTLAPLVPFDFVSGELSVQVTGPDGMVDDLGSAPLVQNQLSSAERLEHQAFGLDAPLNMYRLTTLNPRFTQYVFAQEGHHRIRMEGRLRDIWGNVYTGGGTYDVWIAEPLQMLPGVLPGTPFEVGDVYNPALTIAPGFPAEVTIRLSVYPLDGGAPVVREAGGTANAHGYFHPGQAGEVWRFEAPGEYVVDITARYRDPLGRLWVGSVRGAGVIASQEGQLVARGGRWLVNAPAEFRLAWYALAHVAPDVFDRYPAARLRWPYHSGDVLWARDRIAHIFSGLRLMDVEGSYEEWLAAHMPGWKGADDATIQMLANQDELPLVTLVENGCDFGPALAPGQITNESVGYLNAVRSGVTVRQMVIGDETPGVLRTGWDFDDSHNYQRGIGANGDLPGDYTFLFGGAVVRNAALGLNEAAIYGSLLMTIEDNDPNGTRVYPPLRGAANGPDGGPLITSRGTAAEMFFVSTGFQPGQIYTVGDTLVLAGQMAPALPGSLRADVYTPSGLILTINGQANAIGYFHDPAQNLRLSEPGIWRIRLRVSYTGLTSAGQVYPPYPSGGVPGAEARDIFVYVLPEDADVLALDSIRLPDVRVPVALPFNVTAVVPSAWDDVLMHYTVLMNGLVLDSGVQPAYGGIFAYNYDPRRLNQVFPNLDVALRETQASTSADAVRMTFVLQAVDADGDLVMAGRTITLFGDRLLTLHDGWPVEEAAP